ncbi:hypothetical protein H663_018120 [Limnohabitans planktonicus II-D5]|uniref:Uncharacterized protein n=1 Tax=Limnohabitans planktonicus II-D5 TaxID=1293045 RepID=A0A2T7U995_9BURK|nr:hypothetical protein H663_018120 [Limnohabitans planktonicus II-D5]
MAGEGSGSSRCRTLRVPTYKAQRLRRSAVEDPDVFMQSSKTHGGRGGWIEQMSDSASTDLQGTAPAQVGGQRPRRLHAKLKLAWRAMVVIEQMSDSASADLQGTAPA